MVENWLSNVICQMRAWVSTSIARGEMRGDWNSSGVGDARMFRIPVGTELAAMVLEGTVMMSGVFGDGRGRVGEFPSLEGVEGLVRLPNLCFLEGVDVHMGESRRVSSDLARHLTPAAG